MNRTGISEERSVEARMERGYASDFVTEHVVLGYNHSH